MQNLITFSWDMWHPLFPDQLFLTSRRLFLITYTTKSYLCSEMHIACKFYSPYSQRTAFSEGNFYLCVENVMWVLDPFFFVSSHGLARIYLLSTYKVSVLPSTTVPEVASGTKRFALKITWKFQGSRVHKICLTSGNPGRRMTTFYLQAFKDIFVKDIWHFSICFWKSGKVMETQVSNIFLSIWNQQKDKPLGSGPPRFTE